MSWSNSGHTDNFLLNFVIMVVTFDTRLKVCSGMASSLGMASGCGVNRKGDSFSISGTKCLRENEGSSFKVWVAGISAGEVGAAVLTPNHTLSTNELHMTAWRISLISSLFSAASLQAAWRDCKARHAMVNLFGFFCDSFLL